MGQTSSQLQSPPAKEVMKHEGKSNNHKSRKGKRKSAVMESVVDQEQESAKALLQMRGVPIDDTQDLRNGDDVAASQQLIAEGSPIHLAEKQTLGNTRNRKGKKQKDKNKRHRGEPFEFPSSPEPNYEETQYPHLPSTPPRQTTELSPSPYRPSLSQSNHALDDIPTDDEVVTQFQQEFATQGEDANQQALLKDNVYGPSRQPPDDTDHTGTQNTIHSTCQLPPGKPKKRKRDAASALEQSPDRQQALANGEGQHTLTFEFDFEAFDELFKDAMNSANPFSMHEANDMPIDPELHSMSQLAPSVDLSQLDNRGDNLSQKRKRKGKPDVSSQFKKRRRVEELHDTNSTNEPYYGLYHLDRDQENIKDQVLPGYEDLQRQTSPELGSPFMGNLAHKGLAYLDDRVQSKAVRPEKKRNAKEERASQSSSKRSKGNEQVSKEKSGKGGPFTDSEASKLDKFRDTYCNANDMTKGQFNNRIQSTMRGNADVIALFNEIQDLFPYRPRMSVQKFCRRRFHNFSARGTWTPKDDEMLRQAVNEKGKQWKLVGEMIDRMGEDCRDRYRNYILNAENRNHEYWTPEEVRSLCTAVLDSVETMKDERRQRRRNNDGKRGPVSESESDMEEEDMKAINWQAISDRMGGQRSRLQCSGKWRQLEKQEKNDVAQSILDQRGLQGRRLQPTKNPWRMKNATKKVANMKPGDMHALVQAILDCCVPVEGNLPWKALGDDEMRATWNSTAKKAAWSKLKQDVPNAQFMDYRDVASYLLTKIEDEGAGNLEERWDPETHGDVTARRPRNSKKARGKEAENAEDDETGRGRRKQARKSYKEHPLKSNEFVQDSDDEQEAPTSYQLQNQNRFDALRTPGGAVKGLAMNGHEASNGTHFQQQRVTDESVGDEDDGSLFNGSENGHDDDDELMGDPDISPTLARQLKVMLPNA
jgi:hypothetical protein